MAIRCDEDEMPSFETRDGLSLYYEAAGLENEATPVVFLNGMTQTTRHWASHVRVLREAVPVITFDARGQGKSDPPREVPALSVHADDVAALLDHLSLGEVDIVGFSHGARVALGVATDHPRRVRRLVLCSATAEPTALARTIVRSWGEILSLGGLEALSWASLTSIVGPHFLEQNERLLNNIVKASVDRNSEEGVALLLQGLAEFPPLSDIAGTIGAPTLVISGDSDPLVTVEGARKLARLCGGEHRLVEKCGHTIPIEEPEIFRDVVVGFLG
jgi:3-oxoadipate enol-lactonase